MNDIAAHITGSEKITDVFGYWPSFHDAEIINFHLWRGDVDPERDRWVFPVLTLLVHLWELTNQTGPDGFLICKHETLATLRFHEVDKLRMVGFNQQNAIFHLGIERKERDSRPSPYFAVTLEPAHGIDATFECLQIEVVDAKPHSGKVEDAL